MKLLPSFLLLALLLMIFPPSPRFCCVMIIMLDYLVL